MSNTDKIPLGPPAATPPGIGTYTQPNQNPTERPAPTRSDPSPDTRKGPGR